MCSHVPTAAVAVEWYVLTSLLCFTKVVPTHTHMHDANPPLWRTRQEYIRVPPLDALLLLHIVSVCGHRMLSCFVEAAIERVAQLLRSSAQQAAVALGAALLWLTLLECDSLM